MYPPFIFFHHFWELNNKFFLFIAITKSMFSLLYEEDGTKVDLWILKDTPFDQSFFSRRIEEEVFGIKIYISSPEDTILAKLRWAKLSGGSEKQFTDALRVYELQSASGLDINYIEYWVQKLDIIQLWNRLLKEAEIL